MFIIQSKNLEARGILNEQTTALNIQEKWFRPGPAFTKALRQIAIEFCEDALCQERQYILIEFPSYIMAWRRFRPNRKTQAQSIMSLSRVPTKQISSTVSSFPPAFVNPSYSEQQNSQSVLDDEVTTQELKGVSLDDAVVQLCKAELAIHIGPMADFITERTIRNSAQLNSAKLIAALATYIPNTKAGLLFKWTLTEKIGR